jgi:hypothetical protein
MTARSVFAVDRAIWDDADFSAEAFTEREAWMWLISACAWKELKTRGSHGKAVVLQRGEFSFSVRFLAQKWLWSKDRVHRYLGKLRTRDMIRDTSRDKQQVYFIKNYNAFQVVGIPNRDSRRDSKRDASATAARQQRDKEEAGKQVSLPLANANGRGKPAAVPKESSPQTPAKPDDPWKEVYDYGKQILGSSAGGVITNLKKMYGDRPKKVMAKLEDASKAENPKPYINAFLLAHGPPDIQVGSVDPAW